MHIYTGMIAPDDPHIPGPQKAMLDATPDCVKILSLDGNVLMMNKAGCLALGVPENSEMGMPWLPLLSENVRPTAAEALLAACAGETVRFPGENVSPNGTTFWDNLLIPISDPVLGVLSIFCVSRDVTDKKIAEQKLEDALNRERLLALEMHHRVKNAFTVVAGLITIAEKEARILDNTSAATAILRDKIGALARATDAVFANGQIDQGDAELSSLAKSVLRPYGEQCSLIGVPISIDRNAVTPMVLFLHELATNSVKYGALSVIGGAVTLQWASDDKTLGLRWIEEGGPRISSHPRRIGFGSQMIDRLMASIGGQIEREWRVQGLAVDLRLPVIGNGDAQ